MMRLLRLQRFLVAFLLLSFLVCLLLAIAFISESDFDRNVLEPVFGDTHRNSALRGRLTNLSVYVEDIYGDRAGGLSSNKSNASYLAKGSISQIWLNTIMHAAEKLHEENAEKFLTEPSNDSTRFLPNYDVHIFYYPWYGNPSFDGQYLHWNHRFLPHWKPEVSARYPKGRHQPPDDIGASYYPRLGPYSSRDPAVLDDHMRQILQSGAGVIAVSWYPPGQADEEGKNVDEVVPLLLDAASRYNLKVCFHIEPYKDRSHANLKTNLKYITTQYGNHSAFYRHPRSSLPVYYIYDSYLLPDSQWLTLLGREGHDTIRGTSLDGIFLGLAVKRNHPEQLVRCGFDGFYTYFASETFTYCSTSRNWPALAQYARKAGVLFVPSIGPGYIDDRIRPWNSANTRDRLQGSYYENSFRAAVVADALPDVISVTSFNEWGEGTQIEEAIPKKTEKFTYLDYTPNSANFYLLLTRKWVLTYARQKIARQHSGY